MTKNMKNRKGLLVGAIVLMLLAGAAPVTAYHIDAPWVPVDEATHLNLNCPGSKPGIDNSGTDCILPGGQRPNSVARGWVQGTPLLVICEQNGAPEGAGVQPATNGMCFASNQKANTDASEPCDDMRQFDPTRPGTTDGISGSQTNYAALSPAGPLNTSHIRGYDGTQCLDKEDWTKLRVIAWGSAEKAALCAADPHEKWDPAAVGQCAPSLALDPDNNHTIYAQVRVGSNANGLMLSPPPGGCKAADFQSVGGTAGDGVTFAAPGTECNARGVAPGDPRSDPPAPADFKTFYYRELLAYWNDGGHVTFFVHFAASDQKLGDPVIPGTGGTSFGGSYWAESISPGKDPRDVEDDDGERLECNRLYDDRLAHSGLFLGTDVEVAVLTPGTMSYFDIFEPVTYVNEWRDDAAQTVCRGVDWLEGATG